MQAQITLHGLQPYLSFLGSFIQFGSSLLLILLFVLLRPYARRRKYFVTWLYAWTVLTIALAAIMLRYNVLPTIAGSPAAISQLDSHLPARLLYFTYQFFKLGFYGLLVAGTLRYVRSAPRFPSVAAFVVFAFTYSALSVWSARNLGPVVVWQTPVATIALGYAAYLLLSLPASRRSLGTSLMGSCLTFGSMVWLLYLLAFSIGGPAATNPLAGVINYNAYLDLAWHLALGFGMVVVLMEDVKHEVDAAHAELAVAHDNLRRASFYDSVTGSLNRQAFAEGLGLEAARAAFGAVVMIDTDNLKDINDEYGHAAGDSMLRYLVEVLRSELRASDKLYRLGGDEFLVVCPGADAVHVGARMRTLLMCSPPLVMADVQIPMCASVGAAPYTSAENLSAAIEVADRAMYADKANRKSGSEDGVARSA